MNETVFILSNTNVPQNRRLLRLGRSSGDHKTNIHKKEDVWLANTSTYQCKYSWYVTILSTGIRWQQNKGFDRRKAEKREAVPVQA